MHSPHPEHTSTDTPFARKVLFVLLGVILFSVAMHALLQSLNWYVYFQQNGQLYELSNRFDFDDESSVPTWIAQALFLAISATAFIAAYVQKFTAPRRLWVFIGTVSLLFSLDEVASLHEYALQTLHVVAYQDAKPTEYANAWLLVLPFLTLIAGWVTWKIWLHFPKKTLVLFVISGLVFISGAVLIDLFTSVVDRETFLHQGILVGIEETAELLGTSVALYAIIQYLESHYGQRFSAALKQLKTT